MQYYQAFVDKGFNQIQEILRVSPAEIQAIISLPGHQKKFELAIKEMKGEVCICMCS